MLKKTNSVKEKLESISQKINDFLQESGPEWAASGQQFIAGLFVLGFLLAFLFHRSLFFLTVVVEFVSLIWYILTIKYAGEKVKSVKIWTTINLYLSVALIALTPLLLPGPHLWSQWWYCDRGRYFCGNRRYCCACIYAQRDGAKSQRSGKTSQVILPMVDQDIHNLEAG